jgi:hypothetical protein
MGKWFAGILAALIGGTVLWFLTNAVFPRLLQKDPAPVPAEIRVECIPSPPTVSPGGTTELTIKVTRNGVPVEGAAVIFKPEDAASPARTVSGGILRTIWTAPNPSAAAYVFPVNVDLKGVRTATEELDGYSGTNCQVLVH